MKRLVFLFLLLFCADAQAQSSTRAQAQAVATCGGQSLTAGVFYPVTQDLTGTLCTASGGGGSTSVTQGTVPWVVSGQGTAGTAATGVVTVQGIASMTPLLSTLSAETTKVIGTVNQGTSPWVVSGTVTAATAAADPCQSTTATYTPISITSATTTRIVAPTSAKRTYVCYMFLLSAIANNIAIVEGTGGTCGAATAGVVGGTTAANGINLAANSGSVFQAGGNAAIATAGTNVDLCLITSAAGPVAGHIKWVQAP